MSKFGIYAICAAVIIMAGSGWYALQLHNATVRGQEIERAKIAAKANQNIADRRERDAKFKRDDVIKLCRDAGLEWFADAGRSYCRPKPE